MYKIDPYNEYIVPQMYNLIMRYFEEFWEDLESLFDEKNRQIIIHSKKVKPIWHIRGV